MWPVAAYVITRSVVCVYVLGTLVSLTKTAY